MLTGGSNADVNGIDDGNGDVYKNGICFCNGNASCNASIYTLRIPSLPPPPLPFRPPDRMLRAVERILNEIGNVEHLCTPTTTTTKSTSTIVGEVPDFDGRQNQRPS